MHRPAHEITARLKQWHIYTVDLGARDSAWNPVSTKSSIHGPCRVTYNQMPDGGVDAHITQAAQ
jgi:hypothetical protein